MYENKVWSEENGEGRGVQRAEDWSIKITEVRSIEQRM